MAPIASAISPGRDHRHDQFAAAHGRRIDGRAIGDRLRAVANTCARSSTTSAPLADGPASGLGQPSRGRDQPQFGQPEVEHRPRRLADILAKLRADEDDDWSH